MIRWIVRLGEELKALYLYADFQPPYNALQDHQNYQNSDRCQERTPEDLGGFSSVGQWFDLLPTKRIHLD